VNLAMSAFRGAFVMHLRLYLFQQSRIITALVMPATMASIAVLVLRQGAATTSQYFHVMVGGGLAGMWGSVVGVAVLTIRREREWSGTLPLLTVVPAPLGAVFGGYLAAEAIAGFVGIIASLGVGALLLGSPIGLVAPATLLVSLPVAALSIAAVAFPITAAVLALPQLTRWINAMDYPVWILAGFLFPIGLLPGWTTPLSYLLPVYWATQALTDASLPTGAWPAAGPDWLAAVVLSVAFVAAGVAVLRAIVRHIHRSGVLVGE
jgi:ABC-2 type transport system permease protein